MTVVNKLKIVLNNPWRLGQKIMEKSYWLWTDSIYLKLYFLLRMRKVLSLKHPKTYNEKLQWLKIYDRNPLYTKLVDKYDVKEYVEKKIGKEYVANLLGVWDKPERIDFDKLPQSFVLKTTHGGGNNGVIVVKNKDDININDIRYKLKKAMDYDLYKLSKEWPYKNVKRRIIAEEFLEDKETRELRDYKFFCFDGMVKAMFVATERQTRDEPFFNFYDRNFSVLDLKQGHPRADKVPEKPIMFDDMITIAETLSKDLPHVRVDLYQVNNKIYFGEYTFYHFGGFVPFDPQDWDLIFGSWLHLPNRS